MTKLAAAAKWRLINGRCSRRERREHTDITRQVTP
jgi:hypothetical protein